MFEEIRAEVPYSPTRLSWPFSPRQTKKILPKEAGQIKVLLSHVRAGNMDIEDIARAYGVSSETIRRIQKKKTYQNVRPDKTLKRPARKSA